MPPARTADLPSLDIRAIDRLMHGGSGTLAIVRRSPPSNRLLLVERTDDEKIELRFQPMHSPPTTWHAQSVELTHTPCHFGGLRPWFLCPGHGDECIGRVALLYERDGHFRCRGCHRLRYTSQYEDRIERSARHLRAVVSAVNGEVPRTVIPGPPDRPPNMHRTTYLRHRFSYERALKRYTDAIDQYVTSVDRALTNL